MRRKIPSTQALVCFESAARHQSFTRAAQELHLTQGAVSRQVAALESFVGTPLFSRTRHGMELTPAGAHYAKDVSSCLSGIERDTAGIMNRQGQGRSLVIASVPTFASRWLIPQLGALKLRHPELTVHFETRTRPFMFANTGVDAAIFALTPEQVSQWPGTQATLLFEEAVSPVCHPALLRNSRPLKPQQLLTQPLLQQATRPEAWRHWFETHGLDAPHAMLGPRYELFSMQIAAALAGLGVALVPNILVQHELRFGDLVLACNQRYEHQAYAYYLVHPSQLAPPALQDFELWLLSLAHQLGAPQKKPPQRAAQSAPD